MLTAATLKLVILKPTMYYNKGATPTLPEPIALTLIASGLAKLFEEPATEPLAAVGTKSLTGSPKNKKG